MLLYRNIEIVLAFENKAHSEILKFIITTVTEIKNSVAKNCNCQCKFEMSTITTATNCSTNKSLKKENFILVVTTAW